MKKILLFLAVLIVPTFVYAGGGGDDTVYEVTLDNNYNYGNVDKCKGTTVTTSDGLKVCNVKKNTGTDVTCVDSGYEIYKTVFEDNNIVVCRTPKDESKISYIEKEMYYGDSDFTYDENTGSYTYDSSKDVYCVLKNGNSVEVTNTTACRVEGIDRGESVVLEYDYSTYTTKYYKYSILKGYQSVSELDSNYDYGSVNKCVSAYSYAEKRNFDGLEFCGGSTSVNGSISQVNCKDEGYETFGIVFISDGKHYRGYGCRKLKQPETEPEIETIEWIDREIFVGYSDYIPSAEEYWPNKTCEILGDAEKDGIAELSTSFTGEKMCIINALKQGTVQIKVIDDELGTATYYRYNIKAGVQNETELDDNYLYGNVSKCTWIFGASNLLDKVTFHSYTFCGTTLPGYEYEGTVTCENEKYELFQLAFDTNGKHYKGYGCRCLKGSACDSTESPTPEEPYEPYINYDSLCEERGIKQTAKFIGYIIQLVRWIVPLIIIVLGMIDFGKATIASDDKAINKATSSLIKRIIAGLVVFFIPTIIMAILNAIEITKGIEDKSDSQFGACTKCIFDPYDSCVIPED